jgi:hypothetical protein
MMLRRICVSLVVAVFGLQVANVLNASAQSVDTSFDWLTPKTLQDLKTFLPSYVPSVQAQMAYQAKVPLHQEITVGWSPNEGGQQATGPGFVVTKRWQHMQRSASISRLTPKDRPILVVATTPGGEIRAFALCPDARATTRQFHLQFPEDGQISKLIFVSVMEDSRLEPIGEVKVGVPDGTPLQVSIRKVYSHGSH